VSSNLDIIVQLEKPTAGQPLRHLAVVQVPRVLPSLIKLPRVSSRRDYIFLAHLVGHFLADLFPGTRILGYWQFRITRNSELYIDEEEMPNLLKAVEHELHNRRKGDVVRLEIEQHCPLAIRQALLGTFRLGEADLYVIDGPLNPTRLLAICEGDHSPELRDPPFLAPVLRDQPDLFAAIRQRDILLHHPYDSFSSVVAFVEKAAEDPRVLAIKQTLYRTGGDRQIVGALMNAVRNGKQVTAVVELRARFDEEDNIVWARQLEEAGVHVVYGLVGYKIHAKMCLVVRRDNDGIRRYLHLGTSNYNPNTARLYTDLGLFTCRPDFGEDATNLFNLLTGICQYQGMRKLLIAPFELHSKVLDLIGRETANARAGLPARIIAKLNSLVDEQVIQALYTASQAGVTIELIVRGICSARGQGAQQQYHRAQHCGPVPGTQPDLLLRERLPARGVHGQRRLDAPQFFPASWSGWHRDRLSPSDKKHLERFERTWPARQLLARKEPNQSQQRENPDHGCANRQPNLGISPTGVAAGFRGWNSGRLRPFRSWNQYGLLVGGGSRLLAELHPRNRLGLFLRPPLIPDRPPVGVHRGLFSDGATLRWRTEIETGVDRAKADRLAGLDLRLFIEPDSIDKRAITGVQVTHNDLRAVH
jgi:hypothetical protein